jgi:hypothetical protein
MRRGGLRLPDPWTNLEDMDLRRRAKGRAVEDGLGLAVIGQLAIVFAPGPMGPTGNAPLIIDVFPLLILWIGRWAKNAQAGTTFKLRRAEWEAERKAWRERYRKRMEEWRRERGDA